MDLLDVNVLVYAFREDSPHHEGIKNWIQKLVNGDDAFAVSDLALSGLIRIVTHPRIFKFPSKMPEVISFVTSLRACPNYVQVNPGPRHWEIFTGLCSQSGVKGNLVPDAYLAALAIKSGSEWITTDRDYSRFPKLRWRHP